MVVFDDVRLLGVVNHGLFLMGCCDTHMRLRIGFWGDDLVFFVRVILVFLGVGHSGLCVFLLLGNPFCLLLLFSFHGGNGIRVCSRC